MEGELDTQELKYSMDLDSSSENDNNSTESSKFQEDFLDTQEFSYSVDLSDLSESKVIKVKAMKVYLTFAC